MARRAFRCLVSGRVQGVFYRASTAERAAALKLGGWAKNLPDGSVEVVVAGDEPELTELVAWLWRGPPRARVEAVEVEDWPGPVGDDFAVRG
jgi:acylphosphatase